MGNNFYPLVLARDVEHPGLPSFARTTLQPNKVWGKIILCMRGQGERLKKGLEVQRAGGVGFILGNNKLNGKDVPSDPHFIPATGVSYENALKLIQYVHSTLNPMAQILPGTTVLETKPAPSMASFSSRGPNIVDPNILKPDITSPGVDILATWTAEEGPTRMTFNDTSAVLLKAIHPTWSTAAIRSALMTTDNTDNPLTDETGNPATPFAMGSGHLNPKRAADAGLVYDASYMDYLLYTSNLGKMNLTITVTANWSQILTKHGPDKYYFGWYAWTHQHHVVRSSVAVSFP
ncbi:Subtilisin-like protease SBT5.6 [Glycine soja]